MDGISLSLTSFQRVGVSFSTGNKCRNWSEELRSTMAVVQSVQIPCFVEATKPSTTTSTLRDWKARNLPNRWTSSSSKTTLKMFDEIPQWDTFAWNSILQTHLTNADMDLAMLIYPEMLLRGVRPDRHTLPRLLTASRVATDSFFYGKQIHGHALKLGFHFDHFVITALMALYGQYDGAEAARRLLLDNPNSNNSVSWTLLIKLYTTQHKPALALEVFKDMMQDMEADIDAIVLATVLGACGDLMSLQEGRKIHAIATKFGIHMNVLVANSLLKMYINCRSIKDARMVFHKMSYRDVISSTAIVNWYVKNGEFNEALKLFRLTNLEGIKLDLISVSGILPACARVTAGKNGKEIHAYTIRNGIDADLAVQNSLMDMYIKSGLLESASKIFIRMKDKDAISFTVMILGYSLHGRGEAGVALFYTMKKNKYIEIDDMTYDAVLRACNSARNVEEGKSVFKNIRVPKDEHYSLLVNLLARARLFDDAKAIIEEHGFERNPKVQRALLDGCRIYQEKKTAKRIVERLIELEPLNPDNYILLSNLYASYEQWDIVKTVREMIRDMGLIPKRAYSWIEVRNKVHAFEAGDVSHPRSQRIYHELQILTEKIRKKDDCILDTDFSLHDVDAERECIPTGHSEMLAISLGLICTQPPSVIRVTKNLRVCRGCHSFAKIISRTEGRQIILKDPNRFHHFKDGVCSCQDCW